MDKEISLKLQLILENLLLVRIKEEDAPCSSENHWCKAIYELSKLIPEYKTNDAEIMYQLKSAEINQKVLCGQMNSDEALMLLEQYKIAAEDASWTFGAFFKRQERSQNKLRGHTNGQA